MTTRPGATALENVTRTSSNRPGFATALDEGGGQSIGLKPRKQSYLAPGSSTNRRRRRSDRRFLWLSLLLGIAIATALAVGLYFMHHRR